MALWLALAYDAAGRRDDALDVYRRLEDTHPSAVRTRAAAFAAAAPLLSR